MEETGELGVDGDEGVSMTMVETAELSEIICIFSLIQFEVIFRLISIVYEI